MKIAHDGARYHHACRSPQSLDETEQHQHVDIGRKRRTDAAYGEEHQPAIKRQFTPDHIGQGPAEKLRQRQCQKEGEQAHLHRAGFRPQIGGNGRQGR